MRNLAAATRIVRTLDGDVRSGRVAAVRGTLIEIAGLGGAAQIGSRLAIAGARAPIAAEVTGLEGDIAHCLAFSDSDGVACGNTATLDTAVAALRPCDGWLGRTIDGLGRPLDDLGPLPRGLLPRAIKASPPPAAQRAAVGGRVETGVRALDIFAPLCRGQRLGLFAGSGVGKSVLLSMLAQWTECDVAVIGLVGERGREVQEFITRDLGELGLARSVVVVATSDEPAVMRRQAAWTTLAVAEHFRDQGLHVLCLMDSVTRFAMAQREIGLSSGEPPATKGYTPTVFAELPRLLERAGPGLAGQGSITAVFTVLVDGDDHDEPIADAVRGILDGHVVMSRRIAERGRYPAIDLLKSVSRTLPHCLPPEDNDVRLAARSVLSAFGDVEELVRLGVYKQGANPEVDRAILLAPQIEHFLTQGRGDRGTTHGAFAELRAMLGSVA